ncbi:YebC/PmpR family DNA-binding transcriptional regulator [Clostridia bacterium]|nr:YebC/PmpR family DNA-binding transcriptional regulator [Clostridia bacterium]
MSGHSKWSTIKHKKGKLDAKRAKIFTKIGREIMVAVKLGGPDPDANPRLKLVMQKAKGANMPNDNVKRIIQKASGEGNTANYEELSYEGYGVGGAAVIVDVLTDNRNRTAGDVRHAFDKYGGKMGETGCVSYMFNTMGVIQVDCSEDEVDDYTLMAIEAGAEDMDFDEGTLSIYTAMGDMDSVRSSLEEQGLSIKSSEFEKIPENTVLIEDLEQAKQLLAMMDVLEDNDDVQETWSNFDIAEELEAAL